VSRETQLVVCAGTCLALLGWADVSVQNVSETFFLKRVGVKYLPLAFLVSSLLLVATTYGIGGFAARRNRPRLLWRVFVFVSICLLPLWLLVRLEVPGSVVLLILSAKQIEAIVLIVFWVAMGDLLHGRQAKRLYAPLMSGVTLGTIVGSFASAPIGRLLGIDGLLYFASGVLALGALAALPLRNSGRRGSIAGSARAPPRGSRRPRATLRSRRSRRKARSATCGGAASSFGCCCSPPSAPAFSGRCSTFSSRTWRTSPPRARRASRSCCGSMPSFAAGSTSPSCWRSSPSLRASIAGSASRWRRRSRRSSTCSVSSG
jgi:hypothetical protein